MLKRATKVARLRALQRIAFPVPTRLADGLGLESGLGPGCPVPCAPAGTL